MWGSLARGITETVKETATSAAASVAPHAGDVLRRVGEVVAPPMDNGDEEEEYYTDDDEEDDDGSYYYEEEEEEDGVEFEDDDDGEEGVDLDRYRKKKTVGLGEQNDDVRTADNNDTTTVDKKYHDLNVNSLVNGDDNSTMHLFSEDKSITTAQKIISNDNNINIEKEREDILLKEQEARLHAEQVERDRLAAIAATKKRLEVEEERQKQAELEQQRIEREKILEEERREKERKQQLEARKAEVERMERERILEEERVLKVRQKAEADAGE